jgi:hypothetical protein
VTKRGKVANSGHVEHPSANLAGLVAVLLNSLATQSNATATAQTFGNNQPRRNRRKKRAYVKTV